MTRILVRNSDDQIAMNFMHTSGRDYYEPNECVKCEGRGELESAFQFKDGNSCPDCKGTGEEYRAIEIMDSMDSDLHR